MGIFGSVAVVMLMRRNVPGWPLADFRVRQPSVGGGTNCAPMIGAVLRRYVPDPAQVAMSMLEVITGLFFFTEYSNDL